MRRDSILYKLFQLFPKSLFELLPDPPENAEGYRFDSVTVKEPRFEIDGVILPSEGEPGTVTNQIDLLIRLSFANFSLKSRAIYILFLSNHILTLAMTVR